jgi:hypothetical protein
MSLPVVSANASNPTRDIDTAAGYAGAAGLIAMQLAGTPPGFSLKVPIATVTTDGSGNIATVEPIQ